MGIELYFSRFREGREVLPVEGLDLVEDVNDINDGDVVFIPDGYRFERIKVRKRILVEEGVKVIEGALSKGFYDITRSNRIVHTDSFTFSDRKSYMIYKRKIEEKRVFRLV